MAGAVALTLTVALTVFLSAQTPPMLSVEPPAQPSGSDDYLALTVLRRRGNVGPDHGTNNIFQN